MKDEKYLNPFKNIIFLIFSFVFCILILTPHPSHATLTVASYCQLTIESAQQEISNFNELITLAQQYQDDSETFIQQEIIKQNEIDREKDALFDSYGITAENYVAFMGKNGREVEGYLQNNSDIKQTIDDLSAQINTLLEEYESLKQSIVNPIPPVE